MKQLEKLIIEATVLTEPEVEVERVMQVCNACRYCEGFCAVFPAMTQRLEFGKADIHYLANLCHNCGACLHACQYAPPHEFAINVPKAMAQARLETYQQYAQPAAFGALYRRAGITVALALIVGLTLFLLLAMALKGSLIHPPLAGDFYQIFPHSLLAWMFGSVFVLAIGLLMAGVIRFWREISPGVPRSAEIAEASHNALTLKYLDGGHGKGCNEADDAFTLLRRRFHHFTFYGFMLCFAATVVATGYHYVAGWEAPYPFLACRSCSARWAVSVCLSAGRATVAQSAAVAVTWRCAPETHGSQLYSAAVLNQSYRAGAAGRQRHQRNGHTAGAPFRRGDGALSHPSLRKIRPRIFPLRGLTQMGS